MAVLVRRWTPEEDQFLREWTGLLDAGIIAATLRCEVHEVLRRMGELWLNPNGRPIVSRRKGEQLQPAAVEAREANGVRMLDEGKPYGRVYGRFDPGQFERKPHYEQDGRFFDADKREVVANSRPTDTDAEGLTKSACGAT